MSLELSSSDDPFSLFGEWLAEATLSEKGEANAMVLATSSRLGRVSSRVVLLKSHAPTSFVFYTNYGSAKTQDLNENPYAALLFHWQELGRQVRIAGPVIRSAKSEADEYFATRATAAKMGAWASQQSRVLSSREVLKDAVEAIAQRFGAKEIPRPEFWGGFSLNPQLYEFWQGAGEARMHDRFQFEKNKNNKFSCHRLYP